MNTISILNTKGGVGKTITAVHLGAALAAAGQRVLLVDVDLQHGLTSYFNVDTDGAPTTSDVLLKGASLAEAARPVRERIDLIPATAAMESTDIELASARGGEVRLRRAVKDAGAAAWDFVLIDCPSGWGTVTRNALLASSGLLVPINCAAMAMAPATDTIDGAEELASYHDHSLALVGVLLTCYRATRPARAVESAACKAWPEAVFETRIRKAERIEELAIARATISDVSRAVGGGVAQDYEALGREVIGRTAAQGGR